MLHWCISLQPDSSSNTRKAGLGILILHQQESSNFALYIQAQLPSADSVLMAEAAAITLVAERLNTTSYNFFTDNQIMANFYNSTDPSNPPHWNIKSITATFLQAMKDSQFKVHKIPRAMNSTANALAHQAFNSNSVSTVFSCNAAHHRHLDQCPIQMALLNAKLEAM